MSNRFGPAPTQNNNNHMTDRSSTRCAKPPGGGSTMGSLLYGDNSTAGSFMDERKTRRFQGPGQGQSQTPEHNPIGNKDSYYGKPTAAQLDRERVSAPPGAIPRDALVAAVPQQQHHHAALVRHGSSNNNMAECLGATTGPNDGDSGRRTRRMYGPPGGASSFKLG